jgi:uncharacterized protein (TIGR02757 family)
MISPLRARSLKPLLDALLDPAAMSARVAFDPVRFPRRFSRPDDAEVAGLVSACLAYGRADLFGAVLEQLFARMGPHPGAFAREFDARRDSRVFAGLGYRFNVPADLATLVSAAGSVQREQGSLGQAFARAFEKEGSLRPALSALARQLRVAGDPALAQWLGPTRALKHLLPEPERGGACKRLLLYLRWMVRGGPDDPVDLGLWRQIPPSVLLVPLDTHVARIARNLKLTRRRDLSWASSEDVTASLRRIDPADPVRYDFALCHHGMRGACPRRRTPESCAPCALAGSCRARD